MRNLILSSVFLVSFCLKGQNRPDNLRLNLLSPLGYFHPYYGFGYEKVFKNGNSFIFEYGVFTNSITSGYTGIGHLVYLEKRFPVTVISDQGTYLGLGVAVGKSRYTLGPDTELFTPKNPEGQLAMDRLLGDFQLRVSQRLFQTGYVGLEGFMAGGIRATWNTLISNTTEGYDYFLRGYDMNLLTHDARHREMEHFRIFIKAGLILTFNTASTHTRK
jgi:hypothetical protein